MTIVSIKQFKNSLRKFLTIDQILDQDCDLRLYDTDATSLFKNKPLMVLLPNNTEEVAKIIKLINEHKLNFVARGAGTGLSGGAIAANENSVIVSIARLNKILGVDTVNRTALVETGVINSVLSEHIKHTGLHFAPDPSSQKSCTIGGNIAENAGGIHCYKYGVTSDHILWLEVVLPSGEIVSFSADPRDINLAGLFVGSEGTFGIATKALVKLTPIPESFFTIQICFGSVKEAAELVTKIVKQGFKPAALELMDRVAIEAVDQAYNLGLLNQKQSSGDINSMLLIELDGDNDEILLEASKIKLLIGESRPLLYKETQNREERDLLWKARKGVAAAFGQIAPYWYLYDAVVPRSKIPMALEAISEIAKRRDLLLATMCHAADGNLHPNFLYDPDKDPTVIDRIFEASHEIMKLCIDLGGTLSGEHGIGVEKQEYMDYLFTEDDMDIMMQVRKIFDPDLISNSNKLFPVRLCKEC